MVRGGKVVIRRVEYSCAEYEGEKWCIVAGFLNGASIWDIKNITLLNHINTHPIFYIAMHNNIYLGGGYKEVGDI